MIAYFLLLVNSQNPTQIDNKIIKIVDTYYLF